MDAKAIVREMRKNNQSKEEIISNLQELGIGDAEKFYEDAIAEEGLGVLSENSEDLEAPIMETLGGEGNKETEKEETSEKAIGLGKFGEEGREEDQGKGPDEEKEALDILDSETKPLFTGGKSLFSGKPTEREKQHVDKAIEDIPKLEVTSVSDEGEKVREIGGRERMEPPEIMKSMPSTSIQDLDGVERKLDELISLTKAVYDLDKKILEANRDVLLRLKEQK